MGDDTHTEGRDQSNTPNCRVGTDRGPRTDAGAQVLTIARRRGRRVHGVSRSRSAADRRRAGPGPSSAQRGLLLRAPAGVGSEIARGWADGQAETRGVRGREGENEDEKRERKRKGSGGRGRAKTRTRVNLRSRGSRGKAAATAIPQRRCARDLRLQRCRRTRRTGRPPAQERRTRVERGPPRDGMGRE